ATRGGATSSLGAVSRPAQANSSSSGGISADVRFIASSSGRDTTFTTNSPVASTFVNESFTLVDVKCTIGGSVELTMKNECGARLLDPWRETVDTQTMGRGTTRLVSRK